MEEEAVKEILGNLQNLDKIPSDMIAQARKLVNTRAGKEMLQEMTNKGINQEMITNMMKEHMVKEEYRTVLVIRPNGMIKQRSIVVSDECPSILHAIKPIKKIHQHYEVWYDEQHKNINKKASKWLGFNVCGMVVITSTKKLTLKDFKY